MTEATIYHNPRCSKSRQTLAILENSGVDVTVIKYLEKPPTTDDILLLCDMLAITPLELIRTQEPLFRELGLSKQDERSNSDWAGMMEANPQLIERPIVRVGDRAILGRPPENVELLLR